MARSPRPRRRPNAARQAAVRKATSALLLGLGVRTTGDWKQTPARVASLWTDQLLAGEQLDPAEVLGGAMRHRGRTPVAVRDIGLHMVCPHHLTVALGRAHVAYAPEDRLAGLGQLSDLVKACTARFVLQEEAVQDICDALVEHLHARAAVATIEAVHPCHNITHPRSHDARTITLARAGEERWASKLEKWVSSEPGPSGPRRG